MLVTLTSSICFAIPTLRKSPSSRDFFFFWGERGINWQPDSEMYMEMQGKEKKRKPCQNSSQKKHKSVKLSPPDLNAPRKHSKDNVGSVWRQMCVPGGHGRASEAHRPSASWSARWSEARASFTPLPIPCRRFKQCWAQTETRPLVDSRERLQADLLFWPHSEITGWADRLKCRSFCQHKHRAP